MDHKQAGPAELARLTGIPVDRWKSIRIKKVRASTEELDACIRLWPEYAYWLTTGMTQPQVGNISPEQDKEREQLAMAGGSPRG